MAFAAALLSGTTKNCLKYLITGDLNENGTIDGKAGGTRDLSVDCPAGPLYDLLTATYADQAAARVAIYGDAATAPRVRISHQDEVGMFETLVNVTGAVIKLSLAVACRLAGTIGILTIEYRNSVEQ